MDEEELQKRFTVCVYFPISPLTCKKYNEGLTVVVAYLLALLGVTPLHLLMICHSRFSVADCQFSDVVFAFSTWKIQSNEMPRKVTYGADFDDDYDIYDD